jgi:aquaporin Z
MRECLRLHWPEYLMEAGGLAIFLIVAGFTTTLVEYPWSPVRRAIDSALLRRAIVGASMGLTAIALIYSPWGQQSGAHYNPAVTVGFFRAGKVRGWDALFYILAQCAGGLAGVLLVVAALGDLFRRAPVSYVMTLPGPAGPLAALAAEIVISFLMMSTVLYSSHIPALMRYTGLFAGALIFLFITIEAPVSGMSMNPARSLSSAAPAGVWTALWVYVVGPMLGMIAAVEAYTRRRGPAAVRCAKLHHDNRRRCIFCGSPEYPAAPSRPNNYRAPASRDCVAPPRCHVTSRAFPRESPRPMPILERLATARARKIVEIELEPKVGGTLVRLRHSRLPNLAV